MESDLENCATQVVVQKKMKNLNVELIVRGSAPGGEADLIGLNNYSLREGASAGKWGTLRGSLYSSQVLGKVRRTMNLSFPWRGGEGCQMF